MNLKEAMIKEWFKHNLNSEPFEICNKTTVGKNRIVSAVKTMSSRQYWTKANTIEAWGFGTKIVIIFPGLLLGRQFWWLYIFAIASSVALIWSSTVKTLPTIILFNVAWVVLASLSIIKHFWWF
jgi:hypothetical protein